MMTLKEYKKTLRYAVGYSASLKTLKRVARASKVKYLPARSKLRLAKRARAQDKMIGFAARYSGGRGTSKPTLQAVSLDYANLSKLEQRVLATMPQSDHSYL